MNEAARVTRPHRRAPSPGGALVVGIAIVVAMIAVLGGAATALAGPLATAVFGGLVLGAVALFLPLPWFIGSMFVLSFLVVGQLTYFARMDRALWFPFLMGAILLARLPLDQLVPSRGISQRIPYATDPPWPVTASIVVFFATLVATSLINASAALQLLVSGKEYVFLWGLYFVMSAGLVRPELITKLWAALPWLMVIQLPLIVYQRFVIVPSRQGFGAAWDAVVGAFGGNPLGGGASGAMGVFCVIAILISVERWRRGQMSGSKALLFVSSGIVSIGLAEVKFAVVLLPIGALLLFRRGLMRKPLRSILALTGSVAAAVVLLSVYQSQYSRNAERQTTVEYITAMFEPSTDTSFINLRTREMGRVAALSFWIDQHGWSQPAQLLIGHGAGASRVGSFVVGEAAKNFPFNIGRSALAMLLWEVGLLGAAAYTLMLFAAYLYTYALTKAPVLDAETQSTLSTMGPAIALLAATLPYNTDLIFSHQSQLILLLCLGYLAMSRGEVRARGKAEAAVHRRPPAPGR